MNFRKVFEAQDDSFQMAPLIDIVFLLLTFFIATGALAAEEVETLIELPRTTTAVTHHRERLDIVVNVTRDGQIWVHNQLYSLERLEKVLTDVRQSARTVPVSVIIRADAKSLHGDIVRVIDACVAARLTNISFVSLDTGRPTGNE